MLRISLAGPLARVLGACLVALGLGGAAMAQESSTGTTTSHNTGIAQPPPGTAAPAPKRLDHTNASVQGNNTPTLPELARQPEATIGSPVSIAGPGGTARTPAGD